MEDFKTFFEQNYQGTEAFVTKIITPIFGNLFEAADEDILKSYPNLNPAAERANILSIHRFGSCELDVPMEFFDITLKNTVQLSQSRVYIQQLLRQIMQTYSAALIAFHYTDNQGDWRVSYISKGSNATDATSAKRYTYLMGENQKCRTAADRFATLMNKEKTEVNITEAFSVEKVSKDFFDNYKKQYELFCEYMLSKPGIRQTIFNGDDKAIRDFNKKLLGRIVFLYFIQKKGWLGVPLNGEWGDGDKNFLTNLFEKYEFHELFYCNVLSVLFFDTLNKKRDNDIVELIKGKKYKIPFLNGGLFEEENKKYREIIFPKEQFHNLFEFFNQYNFTIYEDDPNDHTVAVDPEMLGHIFENLLEDNKDKGAFYTPKEIVHYMCQESLIEYLCATLQIEDEAKEREAINRLIKTKEIDDILKPEIRNINKALDKVKICDPSIGSGAFPMGLLHEIFAVKLTLYIFEYNTSEGFDAAAVKLNIIQNSIYGVDIEKGAVDIARLRFWLSLIVDEPTPKALPNLDYKIVVGNSLVSKLKIGDEEQIIDINWEVKHNFGKAEEYNQKLKTALDNLSEKQKKFFTAEQKEELKHEIRNLKIEILIIQLSFNKELYLNKNFIKTDMGFGLKPAEIKANLEITLVLEGFNNSIQKLEKLKMQPEISLCFFDWKLDFPEIMNEQVIDKVGFDIVIGNPPYLGEKGNKEKFREIKMGFLKDYYQAKMDMFYLFFHLAIDFSKNNGIITFITTNYYTTADGAIKLRKEIKNKVDVIQLINFNEFKVFDSALGQHNLITILKKSKLSLATKLVIVNRKNQTGTTILSDILSGDDIETNYSLKKGLFEGENIYMSIASSDESENSLSLFENILKHSVRLDSILNINSGCDVTISKITDKHLVAFPNNKFKKNDGVFVLNENELNELLPTLNKYEKSLIKTYIKNSDISQYIYSASNGFLIYIKWDENPNNIPNLINHLSRFEVILQNQVERYEEPNWPWFTLHRPREQSIFESKSKILLPYRCKLNSFAFCNEPIYSSRDVFFITNKTNISINLYAIVSILNSKLLFHWLFNKGKRKGDTLELYNTPLSEIPISVNLNTYNEILESCSKDIICRKSEGKDTTTLECQIDELVFKLYNLTYEEVLVVCPDFWLSEEKYEQIKIE